MSEKGILAYQHSTIPLPRDRITLLIDLALVTVYKFHPIRYDYRFLGIAT